MDLLVMVYSNGLNKIIYSKIKYYLKKYKSIKV